MGYLIAALFLLIITFILSLALRGKPQEQAKGMLHKILTGSLGKMLLGAGIAFVLIAILFIGMIIGFDNESPTSTKGDGDPLGCAHYGGEWDTGGLFGDAKCVYNNVDEK
ncbi:hypothetical protein [Bacillus paranthracis]|uniref:hypothetical protein n=1 Tax=Bacillus paranthracis TaxID=2026186 RepID=UPI003D64E64B